jgi:hypothetical protein
LHILSGLVVAGLQHPKQQGLNFTRSRGLGLATVPIMMIERVTRRLSLSSIVDVVQVDEQ